MVSTAFSWHVLHNDCSYKLPACVARHMHSCALRATTGCMLYVPFACPGLPRAHHSFEVGGEDCLAYKASQGKCRT